MKTETRTLDGAINAVCNFWIEKMQKPLNQNNGDNSSAGGVAFMFMNLIGSRAQEGITPEKIELFRQALTRKILADYTVFPDQSWYVCDVDYHPCDKLARACDESGINCGALPCKSHTTIKKDFSVESRFGYGSEFIQLY